MEAVFLIMIGAALFSQSWNVLGLYSEGRTMGVFVGGLGVFSLVAITYAPQFLTGGEGVTEANHLAEITVLKALIGLWALYAVGVAVHGLWDFDERAIGFYSVFLAVASGISFLYFAFNLGPRYTEGVWLSLSAAALALTVIATIMFFYLGVAFSVLRLVAGWFLLLGGGVVAAIGLGIMSAVVR